MGRSAERTSVGAIGASMSVRSAGRLALLAKLSVFVGAPHAWCDDGIDDDVPLSNRWNGTNAMDFDTGTGGHALYALGLAGRRLDA